MKINVWNTIQQLSKERGVDTSAVVNAIKEALKVAATQYFTHNEDVNIHFIPEKGELRVFAQKKVEKKPADEATEISLEKARLVDSEAKVGDTIEIDLPSSTLGRIAAQAAKQVLLQKVRTAEQEKIYNSFSVRIGELINGVFRRIELNENIIMDVNKTEVLLPYHEKLINDQYVRGDRVRAVIHHVSREEKDYQVIVSRISPIFLKKLLEVEIPEIANGNIEIMDIHRQPGERAKVSVVSKEKDIDPIGACIGVRGNRILAISNELRGEKIDIIVYSIDPREYAKSALSPAKPLHVSILSHEEKRLRAVVNKDQLSLAIGKKGINVRLASRLVGWRIDIESE